jgi:ribonuclease HII
MRRIDALYPRYGFSSHVGYITPRHTLAVQAHGPCDQHRRSFNAKAYADTLVDNHVELVAAR